MGKVSVKEAAEMLREQLAKSFKDFVVGFADGTVNNPDERYITVYFQTRVKTDMFPKSFEGFKVYYQNIGKIRLAIVESC